MPSAAASASPCRAYHTTLDVPTVFYCLALFQLPRTSMVIAFTMAVQGLTELVVSIRRIDEFLCMPEPPQRKVCRLNTAYGSCFVYPARQ